MSDKLLTAIQSLLEDNKAEDIITVNLNDKSAIADHMVIASGRSSRHVASLADMIDKDISKQTPHHISVEGKSNGDWVVVDCGDVIVHLFRPEVREFYNLEKIWCDPSGSVSTESTIAKTTIN